MQKVVFLLAVLLIPQMYSAPVAAENYPGESCERTLNHVVRYARGVRIADDSVTASLGHMQRKEKSGDKQGVEGEREYMERVWARQATQHSALAGALGMATALGCDARQIQSAARCGYEKLGNGCQ